MFCAHEGQYNRVVTSSLTKQLKNPGRPKSTGAELHPQWGVFSHPFFTQSPQEISFLFWRVIAAIPGLPGLIAAATISLDGLLRGHAARTSTVFPTRAARAIAGIALAVGAKTARAPALRALAILAAATVCHRRSSSKCRNRQHRGRDRKGYAADNF